MPPRLLVAIAIFCASSCVCYRAVEECDPGACGDAGTGGGLATGGGSAGGGTTSTGGGTAAVGGGSALGGGGSIGGGGGGAVGGGGATGGGDQSGDGGGSGGGSGTGGGSPAVGGGTGGGSSNGGGGGFVVDAGGTGGGSLAAASVLSDGGCSFYDDPSSSQDTQAVRGYSTSIGTLDYSVQGYSAGISSVGGLQAFTNGQQLGVPLDIFDTGVWAWVSGGSSGQLPVVPGIVYSGDNDDSVGKTTPLLDYRVLLNTNFTSGTCPAGAGSGTFVYSEFVTQPVGYSAHLWFEFHCPDAGIDVIGCSNIRSF